MQLVHKALPYRFNIYIGYLDRTDRQSKLTNIYKTDCIMHEALRQQVNRIYIWLATVWRYIVDNMY